jgi:hypothetical protein
MIAAPSSGVEVSPQCDARWMFKRLVAMVLISAILISPGRAGTLVHAKAADSAAELPESSPSSPPLETDDPGTPGRQGYEINFIVNCDKANSSRSCQTGVDAAFGLGDKAQLRISKSIVEERIAGDAALNGLGPTDIGIKYRFYAQEGWQLGIFPSIDLDDGARRREADGTPIEREGQSIYLPIIVSKDVPIAGQVFTLVGNAAWRQNLEHPGNDAIFVSLAVGRAIDEASRLMAETVSECNSHWQQCRNDVRVGYAHAILNPISDKYQTSFFGSLGVGRNSDKQLHTTILFGISVAKKPE